ncbi:MAG TPA: PTS mannose transporter subunit IIAB [Candidatus Cloacimonas sp.]|jgi:fructose-specific phosphotransferase system IIA component|nr:fructose system component [Candidatus Cloacimonadota bacterium]HCX73096.1 PTS mannose transporter subunit IIAB [Candidatus Cloacimonas sp.]
MELFSANLIKINYPAIDKKSCIDEMVEFLYEQGVINSTEQFLQAVWQRENIMSTGIGHQIAIPHAHSSVVKEFKAAVYLLDNHIDFDSIDGEPVKLVMMLAVPEKFETTYMKTLSKISNFLRTEDKRIALLAAQSKEEILEILEGMKI